MGLMKEDSRRTKGSQNGGQGTCAIRSAVELWSSS